MCVPSLWALVASCTALRALFLLRGITNTIHHSDEDRDTLAEAGDDESVLLMNSDCDDSPSARNWDDVTLW